MCLKEKLQTVLFGAGVVSNSKAKRSAGAGVSPWCGKGFTPTVNFQCLCSLSAQSHASASVRTLKIPNTGSNTIVWTHENATHTSRNG